MSIFMILASFSRSRYSALNSSARHVEKQKPQYPRLFNGFMGGEVEGRTFWGQFLVFRGDLADRSSLPNS